MRRSSMALAGLLLLCTAAGAAQVPPPASVLGFEPGTDYRLADWTEITGYFERLAAASDRVRVDTLGETTRGRPFLLLTVSSPANLARLDELRAIQERLADPRRIRSEEEAERLVREGRVVVLITAAIHSTEVGAGQVPLRIAYRLASEESEAVRRILDESVVLLVPSLNPDGLQWVVDWYESTRGEPWEGTAPPFLYHYYAGHDNNRDGYAFTQVETRLTVTKVHNVWHPHIHHDIHEMGGGGARFFVPPWTDPVEPNVDPLLVSAANGLGTAVAWAMHLQGKTGVVVNAIYDAWTPARAYIHYKGGVRILTETASARMASPVEVPFDSLRGGRGYDARERSWNFPEPWPGGTWRLRDVVGYMEAGAFALLDDAARHREQWLRTFLAVGRRAVAGRPGWPAAIAIPPAATTPEGLPELLRILRTAEVEVSLARAPFRAGGREFPAGTYVVPAGQPYFGFAKAVLEPQVYPHLREWPGGPLRQPYDVTAHTLSLLLGVEAVHLRERPAVELAPVLEPPRAEFRAEGLTGARAPRIGIYRSFDPSMDEGWTRWVFDRYGIAYVTVHDADVRAGGLRRRFDVLLLPDQAPGAIVEGRPAGTVPPEYAGGLGAEGVAALRAFVEAGGTLVTFNRASLLPVERFGLPVRNVLAGLGRREFYAPGSILGLVVDTRHPLGRGMPRESVAWVEDAIAWEPVAGAPAGAVEIVARFREGDPLLSGWLEGGDRIAGRGALALVRWGRGQVVLFAFRPQYRGQSVATYPLVFNALRAAAALPPTDEE
jgi:hypothetical protein